MKKVVLFFNSLNEIDENKPGGEKMDNENINGEAQEVEVTPVVPVEDNAQENYSESASENVEEEVVDQAEATGRFC